MTAEWEPPEDICPYCHRKMRPRKSKALPHLHEKNREQVLAMVREAIERAGGNKSAAARALGVSLATIFRLAKKLS